MTLLEACMPILSERIGDLRPSAVRAMLEAAQQPDVISFAGGLPASESFGGIALPPPDEDLWQYGPTEGEPALRARLAVELAAIGLEWDPLESTCRHASLSIL